MQYVFKTCQSFANRKLFDRVQVTSHKQSFSVGIHVERAFAPFQDWGLFAPQFLRGLEATVLCLSAVAAVASMLAVEHEGSNKSSDVQALPRKAAVIIGVRRLRCVGFSPCSLPHCLDS